MPITEIVPLVVCGLIALFVWKKMNGVAVRQDGKLSAESAVALAGGLLKKLPYDEPTKQALLPRVLDLIQNPPTPTAAAGK